MTALAILFAFSLVIPLFMIMQHNAPEDCEFDETGVCTLCDNRSEV